MARVIDYAWGRPSIASLKAAGAIAVCRYLAYNPANNGKCLSRAEADGLRAGGIDIVSNWEQGGSWTEYSGGFATGVAHATEAAKQHTDFGGPAGRPIYFSTDFNPASILRGLGNQQPDYVHRLHKLDTRAVHAEPGLPPELVRSALLARIQANTAPRAGQLATIADYYLGVASVIGLGRTGAYGGYNTIKYLFDAGVIRWGWQTYAWSAGQWDSRAQLRQVQNGVLIGGVDSDLDESMTGDFGQWGAGGTTMTNLGYSEQDGQFLCARVEAAAWLLPVQMGPEQGRALPLVEAIKTTRDGVAALRAAAAEDATRDAAALGAINALTDVIRAGGGSVEDAAIIGAVQNEAALVRQLVEQRHAEEMAALQAEHAEQIAGLQAQLDALRTGTAA
jgi:hypothetical protein